MLGPLLKFALICVWCSFCHILPSNDCPYRTHPLQMPSIALSPTTKAVCGGLTMRCCIGFGDKFFGGGGVKKIFQIIARYFGYELHRMNVNAKSRSAVLLLLGRKRHADITVFDVGAHEGQTIKEYLKIFPNARFFSFEPFPESYDRLSKYQNNSIQAFPFGLSDRVESQTFFINKGSATNSLLALSKAAQKTWNGHRDLYATGSVVCEFSTLDGFVSDNCISVIDFLKIDVQGAEYKVIEGGAATLAAGIVNVVKCEVILSDTYDGQQPLHVYLARFEELGFELVNICDLVYGSEGNLIQVDLIMQHRSFRCAGER